MEKTGKKSKSDEESKSLYIGSTALPSGMLYLMVSDRPAA